MAGLPGEADVRYLVQVPLEYDPLRHYPTIVTLADAGVTPEQMLDFWSGPADKDKGGDRLGQATRHGYIVIAVDWQSTHQFTYDYSAREHHAVLGALRDACRRFSIDIDRVFLSGHGIGGDAAWDIAIAHPDLWAGVIPIVRRGRQIRRPLRDECPLRELVRVGGRTRRRQNGPQRPRARSLHATPTRDVTVVEYQGRGYEPFGDEIQRLFEWMGLRAAEDAQGYRVRVDAAVGHVLLVAGSRRLATQVDGAARKLAAAQKRCGPQPSPASGWKRTRFP